jgi:hypothetical protein
MILTVKERGQFVATSRYVQVWLMETLGGWVPTTPEMEVKLLFGEQIWDAAQHADALGKRTAELRMPIQHSETPAAEYVIFLQQLRDLKATAQRLAVIYDILLPGLAVRDEHYLGQTDSLADAPTVRILEHHQIDVKRMLQANLTLRNELTGLPGADASWTKEMQLKEASFQTLIATPTETISA